VTGPECQRTLYFESGGQPGNRLAWLDASVNAGASSFFLNTLDSLEQAYVRPRYDGFVEFHDQVGLLLQEYLRNPNDKRDILSAINKLYLTSGWRADG
jgi:multiple sugar transport system substrate-binding protein